MNDVFSGDRRSRSSKTTIIGDSQIPAELGQTITGALANIPFPFGIDATTGDYGYYKAGADTVTPFKSSSRTVLWTNPSPSSAMGYVTITLSENITNYDYADVELCYSTSGGTSTHVYCRTSDMMASRAGYSGESRIIACSAAASNGINHYYRYIGSTNGIEVFISGANCVATAGTSNNLAIPVAIAGVKGSL